MVESGRKYYQSICLVIVLYSIDTEKNKYHLHVLNWTFEMAG
jgi:hypothetical protein